jgi:hypothetical protein
MATVYIIEKRSPGQSFRYFGTVSDNIETGREILSLWREKELEKEHPGELRLVRKTTEVIQED